MIGQVMLGRNVRSEAMRRERLISRVAKRVGLKFTDTPLVKSVDIIGDIAVVKIPDALRESRFRFADALLREASNIKAVYRQAGSVSGDYRLRDLEWLAGERRSITNYREDGCNIEVDLEKDYFSPRLAYERTRIAKQAKADESSRGAGSVIVNMFAGVGSFSLRIAKETRLSKIYSIDVNPDAFIRMFRNVLANKMLGRIVCVFGDAAHAIENVLKAKADRVLMPLPEKSLQYLESAIAALKHPEGIVHVQNFIYARKGGSPIEASRSQLETSLQNLGCRYTLESERIIRSVGPGWYQTVHDIKVVTAK
jgi:tRNA (guanine37-N1)-methyltransferase